MKTFKAFNAWLEDPKRRIKIILLAIALAILYSAYWDLVHGQSNQAYGYADQGACENDVQSRTTAGYSKIYPNELKLIAEQEHDYYRLSGDRNTCYRVPSKYKTRTAVLTTMSYLTIEGVETVTIAATGYGLGPVGARVVSAIAAVIAWEGWENLEETTGIETPITFNYEVSMARGFTYSALTDPCVLATQPNMPAAAHAACRKYATNYGAIQTELKPSERVVVYTYTNPPTIPTEPTPENSCSVESDCRIAYPPRCINCGPPVHRPW